MKTKGKAWHLVVTALLILVFVYTAFFGVSARYGDVTKTYIKGAKDIRFGVDIKGGVNVTFVPSDGYDATDEQLEAAQLVIENRLVALNVTDYELYLDYDTDSLILEFPWQSGETDFDPEAAIEEIGTTAYLTFREGSSLDGALILDGSMVESASAQYGPVSSGGAAEYYVSLKFTAEGTKAFGDATTRLYQEGGSIGIWLDEEGVSVATVNAAITDGAAIITSSASEPFTQEDVVRMARQINSGALPFALTADSYSTVSPSLGENSLSAMVLAGVIAFVLIGVFMTALYRLPGLLACIALAGQVAATLAFVSGYFPVFESFTLTLPGIAGIILAIGMGVDANVITAERIKEELNNGKSLDGALKSGFARGLTPIIDGNVTIVIVAVVLMSAFGPSDSFMAKLLHFVFFAFGPSTAGTIYAFGYTLLTGVLLNFVFGVFATRVMIRGAAAIPALRNPWLYGAPAAGKAPKEKKALDFVGMRKKFLTLSGCVMVVILLCAVVFGVKLDTEFTGGAMITLRYENEMDLAAVQKTACAALENNGLTLQTGENVATGEQTLKISMPGNETVTTDQVEELLDSLNENYPDNGFAQLSLSNVSAAMGTKFLQKSLVAVVFALVLILAYIALRFKNIGGLTGGMMAVLALINDLMIVFGTFVLLRTPLDGNFIAAMLTILGYSINDTVVVYDRIRENRKLASKKTPFAELVNHSVNQSARRTVITTVSTVMALGVMCVVAKLYGLDSIFTFAFPLMMGMLSGVFTSLCVSTSAWVLWTERKASKN
ncbi:MAG: protein translocase subunit SecF [Faecalibacterium sp.]